MDLNVEIKKSFGEKFKLVRTQAGYSRAKLGAALGVSAKTVQSWESGRTFPENMALIPTIRDILGFFIPKILGETVVEQEAIMNGGKKVVRRAAVVVEESTETETEEIEEDSTETEDIESI